MDLKTSQLKSIQDFYGNRLRVRSCGLCVKGDSLLMIKQDLGNGEFWSPPGGGIQVGEGAAACLKRELAEETGIIADGCDFLFACEFIKEPLHAIELYFMVSEMGGDLKTGTDPEKGSPKIILEARFLQWDEIARMEKHKLHGIFEHVSRPAQILDLRGYFTL